MDAEDRIDNERAAREWLRRFIARRKWVFAKTMPQIPHEYTVRDKANPDPGFTEAAALIQTYGYHRKFGRRTFIYFAVDERRYWTMGAAPYETTVINRCLNE